MASGDIGGLVLLSDPAKGSVAKASSVLQKNSKLNGPMHALDINNPSTSWNSDGTSSGKQESFFVVDFNRTVTPMEVQIQFQAGFSAEEVIVQLQNASSGAWEALGDELETEDAHGIQKFDLLEEGKVPKQQAKAIKLVFNECTDFYGRVIVYQLQVWGNEETSISSDTSKARK